MVFVAPDLEFTRRRVIAESAVALHRCALGGTFESEPGAGGAPDTPLALDGVPASFLLLPAIFDEVLLGRQGERQAATTVGSSGCQISDGRRTIGIEAPGFDGDDGGAVGGIPFEDRMPTIAYHAKDAPITRRVIAVPRSVTLIELVRGVTFAGSLILDVHG